MAALKRESTLYITPLSSQRVTVRIIGRTPMIQNRMPAKVMQGLLLGSRKKTRADKLEIKHDPHMEFLQAAEIMKDGPTALGLKVVSVKAAMADAALETAGVTKTSAQRLLFMPGDRVPLFGVPKLRMDVVRTADMNHTPDIRCRPCLEQWCAALDIEYVTPQLTYQSVFSLLFNAGIVIGIGDGRQAKGKLNCGLFRVLNNTDEDEEWNFLTSECGREAQQQALDNPQFYDQDSADLFGFWQEEYDRRSAEVTTVAQPKTRQRNGKQDEVTTNA